MGSIYSLTEEEREAAEWAFDDGPMSRDPRIFVVQRGAAIPRAAQRALTEAGARVGHPFALLPNTDRLARLQHGVTHKIPVMEADLHLHKSSLKILPAPLTVAELTGTGSRSRGGGGASASAITQARWQYVPHFTFDALRPAKITILFFGEDRADKHNLCFSEPLQSLGPYDVPPGIAVRFPDCIQGFLQDVENRKRLGDTDDPYRIRSGSSPPGVVGAAMKRSRRRSSISGLQPPRLRLHLTPLTEPVSPAANGGRSPIPRGERLASTDGDENENFMRISTVDNPVTHARRMSWKPPDATDTATVDQTYAENILNPSLSHISISQWSSKVHVYPLVILLQTDEEAMDAAWAQRPSVTGGEDGGEEPQRPSITQAVVRLQQEQQASSHVFPIQPTTRDARRSFSCEATCVTLRVSGSTQVPLPTTDFDKTRLLQSSNYQFPDLPTHVPPRSDDEDGGDDDNDEEADEDADTDEAVPKTRSNRDNDDDESSDPNSRNAAGDTPEPLSESHREVLGAQETKDETKPAAPDKDDSDEEFADCREDSEIAIPAVLSVVVAGATAAPTNNDDARATRATVGAASCRAPTAEQHASESESSDDGDGNDSDRVSTSEDSLTAGRNGTDQRHQKRNNKQSRKQRKQQKKKARKERKRLRKERRRKKSKMNKKKKADKDAAGKPRSKEEMLIHTLEQRTAIAPRVRKQMSQMNGQVFTHFDLFGMHEQTDADPDSDSEGEGGAEPQKPLECPLSPKSPGEGATEQQECVICMSEKPEIALLPCRHLCLCSDCADILPQQDNRCPICRKTARRMLKVVVPEAYRMSKGRMLRHAHNLERARLRGGISPSSAPATLAAKDALNAQDDTESSTAARAAGEPAAASSPASAAAPTTADETGASTRKPFGTAKLFSGGSLAGLSFKSRKPQPSGGSDPQPATDRVRRTRSTSLGMVELAEFPSTPQRREGLSLDPTRGAAGRPAASPATTTSGKTGPPAAGGRVGKVSADPMGARAGAASALGAVQETKLPAGGKLSSAAPGKSGAALPAAATHSPMTQMFGHMDSVDSPGVMTPGEAEVYQDRLKQFDEMLAERYKEVVAEAAAKRPPPQAASQDDLSAGTRTMARPGEQTPATDGNSLEARRPQHQRAGSVIALPFRQRRGSQSAGTNVIGSRAQQRADPRVIARTPHDVKIL